MTNKEAFEKAMADSLRVGASVFNRGDEMKFGRYKGKSIQEIMDDDPDYFRWLCENVDGFHEDYDY